MQHWQSAERSHGVPLCRGHAGCHYAEPQDLTQLRQHNLADGNTQRPAEAHLVVCDGCALPTVATRCQRCPAAAPRSQAAAYLPCITCRVSVGRCVKRERSGSQGLCIGIRCSRPTRRLAPSIGHAKSSLNGMDMPHSAAATPVSVLTMMLA